MMINWKKKIFLFTIIFYGIFVLFFSYWGISSIDRPGKMYINKKMLSFCETTDRALNEVFLRSDFNQGSDPTPVPPMLPLK